MRRARAGSGAARRRWSWVWRTRSAGWARPSRGRRSWRGCRRTRPWPMPRQARRIARPAGRRAARRRADAGGQPGRRRGGGGGAEPARADPASGGLDGALAAVAPFLALDGATPMAMCPYVMEASVTERTDGTPYFFSSSFRSSSSRPRREPAPGRAPDHRPGARRRGEVHPGGAAVGIFSRTDFHSADPSGLAARLVVGDAELDLRLEVLGLDPHGFFVLCGRLRTRWPRSACCPGVRAGRRSRRKA